MSVTRTLLGSVGLADVRILDQLRLPAGYGMVMSVRSGGACLFIQHYNLNISAEGSAKGSGPFSYWP